MRSHVKHEQIFQARISRYEQTPIVLRPYRQRPPIFNTTIYDHLLLNAARINTSEP